MKKLFLLFVFYVISLTNIFAIQGQRDKKITQTIQGQGDKKIIQTMQCPQELGKAQGLRPEVKLLEAMSDAATKNDVDRAMVWAGVQWAFPANLKRQLKKLDPFVACHYFERLKLADFDVCGGIVIKKEKEIDRLEGFIKDWLDVLTVFAKFNHALEEIDNKESLIFSDLFIWNNIPEECLFNNFKESNLNCSDLIKKYNEKIKNARNEMKIEIDSLKNYVTSLQNKLKEMEKNYKDLFEDEKEILEKLKQFNELKNYLDQQINQIDLMLKRLNLRIGSYICHPDYMFDPYDSTGKCLDLVKCTGDFIDDKESGLCKCKDLNKKPSIKEKNKCEKI